ncbi:hypothetical protein AAFF_G00290660 [Aldrovandia affinis]|uniref:Uncharacterized protein n=1 Tax=Aldrovandia affinis TaxID=143900 RepID=A0AAD7R9E9_9TELE|nr:hypothetical protein AAFF_G00290660 [Aldrovandia affinis]
MVSAPQILGVLISGATEAGSQTFNGNFTGRLLTTWSLGAAAQPDPLSTVEPVRRSARAGVAWTGRSRAAKRPKHLTCNLRRRIMPESSMARAVALWCAPARGLTRHEAPVLFTTGVRAGLCTMHHAPAARPQSSATAPMLSSSQKPRNANTGILLREQVCVPNKTQ